MSSKIGTSIKQTNSAVKAEEAVLDLLEEQGVLAGINLNDVAKAAGVSRTLVYHNFGSRRQLLRSAIKHELNKQQIENETPSKPMRLGARVIHALRTTLKACSSIKLMTLLHLDGSTAPRLMPNAETTLLKLERDQTLGLVPSTDDLPALHASYASAVYGYVLFRDIFARDLNIEVSELDERVMVQFELLFDQELKKNTDTKEG